ncbi:MAG: ABC transporter permease [Lachnospiraceae bacterium]|nr:ABC transporter permease [Lachnospiraceae bacterium]
MKQWLRERSPGEILRWGLCFLCLAVVLTVTVAENVVKGRLYDQRAAQRWSENDDYAQISCFFSGEAGIDELFLMELEHKITTALGAASITQENENARLWLHGTSLAGSAVLNSDLGTAKVKAYGVSGDFFQFHPVKLLHGAYFNDETMMQDNILIDEETAWRLFGSNDVAGMQVTIGGVPHRVGGVFARDTGRLAKAAGLAEPVCFLSLSSLEQYATADGQYCYEVLMPNPISGFALSTVIAQAGMGGTTGENGGEEREHSSAEFVENTTRYRFLPLWDTLREFATRSMSHKGIVYPYWENIARGWEDILALTLLMKLVFIIYPAVFSGVQVIRLARYLWRRWKGSKLLESIKSKLY